MAFRLTHINKTMDSIATKNVLRVPELARKKGTRMPFLPELDDVDDEKAWKPIMKPWTGGELIIDEHMKMSYLNKPEFIRERSAIRCKTEGIGGFQGCRNYGNGCDFRGFYLARYSDEGFCDDCELKEFPARYYGCLFCRKAIKLGIVCKPCKRVFEQWAFNLFYNKNADSESTPSRFAHATENETNDWKLWSNVGHGVTDLLRYYDHPVDCHKPEIKAFKISGHYSDLWPGFYIGENQWVKPDPFELKGIQMASKTPFDDCFPKKQNKIDISDINWDNRADVLKRELNKLGIYIYSNIQIQWHLDAIRST